VPGLADDEVIVHGDAERTRDLDDRPAASGRTPGRSGASADGGWGPSTPYGQKIETADKDGDLSILGVAAPNAVR